MKKSTLLLLSFLFLWPLGCNSNTAVKPEAAATEKSSAETKPDAAHLPSEAESMAFAEGLVKSIQGQEINKLQNTFHYEKFMDVCFGELDIPKKEYQAMREGFLTQLKQTPGGFFGEFVGSRLKVLRFHEDDGQPKMLVRALIGDPPSLTYLDLFLIKNDAGEVQTFDIYTFAGGERVSSTVRRVLLPMIGQLLKTPLQKLVSGGDQGLAEHLDKIVELMSATKAGDNKKCIEIYKKLPKELQENKAIMLTYVRATMNDGDDAVYLQAIETFQKLYSTDPAVLLTSLDYYFLEKDFDKLFVAIDDLEKGLGVEDPYLEIMKASGMLEKGDYAKAEEHARQAMKEEPELEDSYWLLSNLGLQSKNYKLTVEALNHLKKSVDTLVADIQVTPDYADFLKSDMGKKWVADNG